MPQISRLSDAGRTPALQLYAMVAVSAILVFAIAAHAWWLLPNHDSATYIMEAQKLLAGGRFYDDIMETNPPLIVWMTAPGLLIGRATGLDPWTGFTVWVGALIALSMRLASPCLRWAGDDKPRPGALLIVAYMVAITLVPAYDFGQREHLTIILFLPALLWFSAREAGRPSPTNISSLTILTLGSLGLLIKPFLLVVPAIMVVVRAARYRDWRMLFGIETVVALSVSLLYAALVYIFCRGWLASAALAAQVYFAFQESWAAVLYNYLPDSGLQLAVALVVLQVTRMPQRRKIFLRQLTMAAVIFFAMAILQRKGWSYHVLPAGTVTFLLVSILIIGLFERRPQPESPAMLSLASSAVLVCVIGFSVKHFVQFNTLKGKYMAEPFTKTAIDLAAGRNWVALSTSVGPAFPTILLTGGDWSSRSPHQWLIPGILKLSAGDADDRLRAAHLKQLATGFVTEDLDRYRPSMVAVKTGGDQAIVGPFEFLPFFGTDAGFRRAWAPYRLAKSMAGWQFYLRTPPTASLGGPLPDNGT